MAANGLPLGCFGKVGSARDYVRANAVQPTARALVDWIEDGRRELLERTDEAGGSRAVETSWRRIALVLPGSVEMLAGVVRPSADEGGLREFPFAVFTWFPRRPFGRGYFLVPLALAAVWDALDDAWDALAAAGSPGAFRELAENFRLPAPEPLDALATRYRASLDQEVAWSGPFDGGPALLIRRASGPDGPISAPVAGDLEQACFDATFWIDCLYRRRTFGAGEPVVLIESSRGRGSRTVEFAPAGLRPADYPALMGCGAAPSGPAATAPAGPRPTFAQLLASR